MKINKILFSLLSLFIFLKADYSIVQGNIDNKLKFTEKECSNEMSGFFKNVLSKLHYRDGKTYATVYNNKIKFYYQYPSNGGNDGYKVKLYVYEKNGKYKTSTKELLLKDKGGIASFLSSKDYNGKYYIKVKIFNINNNKEYCFFKNRNNLIEIKNVSNAIGINNVYITPATNDVGKNFIFKTLLSDSLQTEYSVKIEFLDGTWKFRKNMYKVSDRLYEYKGSFSKDGIRKFRVAIFKGDTQKTNWIEKSFTVTPLKINHNPKISLKNADTDGVANKQVTVEVIATDEDGNLGTVQINWGDNGDKADLCSHASGNTYKCTHRYVGEGIYTWAVRAYDNGNPSLESNVLTGKINIFPPKPTITSISPNPLIAKDGYQNVYLYGSNFKSNNIVEWENGGESGIIKNGTGFHFESTSKIRLYMNTTQNGVGTWKFRVKDGDRYSNWFLVEAKSISQKDTQKPTVKILEEENNIPHTGDTIRILFEAKDETELKTLHITSNGKRLPTKSLSGKLKSDYLYINISDVPEGKREVTLQAEDKAGNLSDIKTYHYIREKDDIPTETIKLKTLTTSPTTAKVNTEVIFMATLTENLPSELYRVYLHIDGQSISHEMKCNGKTCTYPEIIKSAGVNRKFTCTLKKGNQVISSKEGTYTIVSDFSISEILPNFLDTDRQNHTITIKGSGFTRNSKIYRKQPNRPWASVGTKYISSTELRAILIPTSERKGKWYFYVQDGTKKTNDNHYILVKQNEAPILNEYNRNTIQEVQKGSQITISLKAYDNDGDVKQIDVNWGDGSAVSSQSTSNNAFKEFTHIYNNYGIFNWGSNAYDNEGKPSNRVTGKVLVYDAQYTTTPSLNQIYSINGKGFLSASGGQYLVLKGSNFSRLSSIEMIRPDGSHDTVLPSCTFAGGKKCIKYKSSTEIGVNLAFTEGSVGEWQFAVKNRDNSSNYKSIEVKQVNIRPYIIAMATDIIVGKVTSGLTKTFAIKAYDGNNNLDKIYMIVDGKTFSKSAKSNQLVEFSFTAPTVSSKKTITLTFQAKDKDGAYSTAVNVPIEVFPNTVDNKSKINKEEVAKRSSCQEQQDSVEGAVSLATGAENFSIPLLKVQGLHTIASIITYNSLLLTDGELSKGWSHNYGISAKLEFKDENSIRIHWDDGRYNDFAKSGDKYISKDLNSRFDILERTSQGYTLTKQNRMVFKFYATGVLQEVSNYLGQKMLITFDKNAKLTSVEDMTSNLKLLYEYNSNGKLAKVVDPQLNREVVFSYDDNGQLSSIESPHGIYTFAYNDLGQMTEKTFGDIRVFKNTYSKDGRVATEDDADSDDELVTYTFEEFTENGIKKLKTVYKNSMGEKTTFIYDAKDFLLYSITDAKGNKTLNRYDPTTRHLIESINSKNQKTKYSYDSKGNLISQTLPNGLVTYYSYDSNRNLLEEKTTLKDGTLLSTKYVYNSNNTLKSKTLPNGDTTKYEYNSNKQLIKSISPSGNVTTYEYEKGRVSKVTYPKGNNVTYRYDEAGRLISETVMPLNATTTYSYDEADRVTKVTDAMGHEVYTTYDQRGLKSSSTDAKGNVTYYRYDGNGNLIKTIYPDNTETTYEYDGEDRVTKITYANGATNRFEYDALGRVKKEIDAMGNFVTFNYDALGNVQSKFDIDGNLIASYKYDAMQNVIEAIDYFNNRVTNRYNQLGLLEETTDPLGRVSKFKYDKLGRLTKAIDALNGISTQSFDKNGEIKDFTDPNNNKTELKHDEVGNLIEIKTASNSTTKYEYDSNSLLKREINGRGQIRTYSYNKNGEVTTIVDDAGTINYSYDENGNLISISENGKTATFTYDSMDRVTSYTDIEANTIRYKYDSVGNLKTLTYPDGKKVEYDYNLANQLISVKDWLGNKTEYQYDKHGRLSKQIYPNGVVLTREYDKGGRLISQKETIGSTRISEYRYEYDKAGNIINEQSFPTISPKDLANIQMSYTKGNLLKKANSTEAIFDKDDNMVEYGSLKLKYDNRNRLIEANGVKYSYNAQNHRIQKSIDGKTTKYIVNPNAPLTQVLIQIEPNGKKIYYVYGLGLIAQIKDKKPLYYHYDLRGSTIALTNSSGNITDKFSYSPYGKLLSHTGSTATPFLFVGKHGVMKEDNELYYMRARYYHERLRRFINRDTLLGEIGDFGSLNRFGYVEGLVIDNIDPTGYDNRIWKAYKEENKRSREAFKNEMCSDDPSSYRCLMGHVYLNFQKVSVSCGDFVGFGSENPIDFVTIKFKKIKNAKNGITKSINKLHDIYVNLGKKKGKKSPHGNNDLTYKLSQLYYLIDKKTGKIMKIGETTKGYSRYTNKYLSKHNVYMKFIGKKAPKGQIKAQERAMLELYKLKNGHYPLLNKTNH